MNSVINTRATNPRGASLDDWSLIPSELLLKDFSASASCGLLRLLSGLMTILYEWAAAAQNIRAGELIMAVDGRQLSSSSRS